jgi:hypothetical protein
MLKSVKFCVSVTPSYFMQYMYRMIQVLPPERKHPLLIDLKFSKNSGMIVYRCRIFCKNLNFFNETGKYFVLIQ